MCMGRSGLLDRPRSKFQRIFGSILTLVILSAMRFVVGDLCCHNSTIEKEKIIKELETTNWKCKKPYQLMQEGRVGSDTTGV